MLSGMLDALLVEELDQLAGLGHLYGDVAPADELARHEKLGESGPIGDLGQGGADLRLRQHVHVTEFHPQGLEHLGGARLEAALGEIRRAFHEQHHGAAVDLLLDALHYVHPGLRCRQSAFTSMLSITSFTPPTLFATAIACSRRAAVGRVPLNVTTCLSVMTLIWKDLSPSSPSSLVLTALVR